jgi:hypothetical protein
LIKNTSPAIAAVGINSCILFKMRIKVDLPQPDGPINAVTVPVSKVQTDIFKHMFATKPGMTFLACR